jgi:hypothetical protein
MSQASLPLPPPEGGRRELMDLKELTGELAKRHGVVMRSNDPAAIVLSALEIVGRRMLLEMELTAERAHNEVTAAMEQQRAESLDTAQRFIGAASQHVGGVMKQSAADLAPVLAQDVLKLVRQLGAEIEGARTEVRRARNTAWWAAGVALAALAALVVFSLGRLTA